MNKKEISYSKYLNKVHGGWLGKCIGGAVGAMQENNKSIMNYTIENIFPDEIPPNDDLDLQVMYLQEVLGKKGTFITSTDLAKAFTEFNLCLANEYASAIKNVELGVYPPLSGSINNKYFKNSMGCPIRSELWGFISPGEPDVAVFYAKMDGMVDHEQESINGECFLAALESCAFFEFDLRELIKKGLKFVPKISVLYRCVNFAIELYDSGYTWEDARNKLVQIFGSGDASYSVVNVGITIIALLYGEGDFTKTMIIAVNCGFDTDCTAATAGAIFGLICGASELPEWWLGKIGTEVYTGTVSIIRPCNEILYLAKETCAAGLSFLRDGMTQTEITNVPKDILPLLPLPARIPAVSLSVEYEDNTPTIGFGECRTVFITAQNNAINNLNGMLEINLPESLECDEKSIELNLTDTKTIAVTFYTKKNIQVLPHRNLVNLTFSTNNEEFTCEFGLIGAAHIKVIGPFWDNYDTRIYTEDPYKGVRQNTNDGGADLKAMFTSFVNLDREYIDESFEKIDEEKCEYFNFHEDVITLNNVVSYKGSYCVYLVYDIYSQEDDLGITLHIGNNDEYKLWLNGLLVSQDRDHPMYMPYNNTIGIDLKKGKNRFVAKLMRFNCDVEFSLLMRDPRNRAHYIVNLGSFLK